MTVAAVARTAPRRSRRTRNGSSSLRTSAAGGERFMSSAAVARGLLFSAFSLFGLSLFAAGARGFCASAAAPLRARATPAAAAASGSLPRRAARIPDAQGPCMDRGGPAPNGDWPPAPAQARGREGLLDAFVRREGEHACQFIAEGGAGMAH